jgi:hypothetical protein
MTSRGAGQGFPFGWGALGVLLVLLFIFGPLLLEMSVDWQWFGSLGLQSVYGTRLGYGLGAFALGTVVAVAFLAANLLLARRIAAPRVAPVNGPELVPPSVLRRVSTIGVVVVGLIFGLIAGGAGLAYWGYKKGHARVEGAGIGIAIEAAATLLFDIWASRRANAYAGDLDDLMIITPRLRFAF